MLIILQRSFQGIGSLPTHYGLVQYISRINLMLGQLYLTYKELVYLLTYDKERIEIYSADNLEIVESIRNLYVDIRSVIDFRDGSFIAITEREAVFYALSTTSRKELFWKKMSTQMIEENIIAAEFCKSSNQLILLSSNLIQCVQCKVRDDLGFVKQSELSLGWMVSVKQELKSMDVSEDEELLALLSEKGRIYIWSLKLIPTVFKKNMNLSQLGENSCTFSFDDAVQQLQFKILVRETKNCLYALSRDHLRVMQEVRDGPNFSFVNLMNIRLHGLSNFIQIHSSLDETKILPSNALPCNNIQSVDPLILQVGSKFILYEFYGIRSSSMKAEFREIKQLQLGFSKINNVLFSDKRTLLIVGQQNSNICQVKLQLDQQHPIKQFLKVYFLKIIECYFSQNSNYVVLKLEDGSFCRKNIRFNNWLNSQPADTSLVPLSIRTNAMGCLNGDLFYFVENELLHMHHVVTNAEKTLPCPREVKFISFLQQLPSGIYFVFDGDIMILNEDKIETFQRLVPARQVIKVEVVPTSCSILFKTNRGYWLYQWFVDENTFKTVEIRKSSEHMIYGGGFWTQLRESEIIFGSGSKALVSFSLDTFLDALSKKHNLRGLKYKLGHLINEVFTLQIQNYFFFLAVILDVKKQRYYVNLLKKNAYSNDYLVIRIPRKASLQRTRLIYMNNCFYIWADLQFMVIGRYPQEAVGLDYRDLTQSVGYINASIHQPVPIQNPYFLKQFLSMGLFAQVDAILQDISILIQQKPLDPCLTVPCITIAKFLNKELGGLKLDINKLPEDLKALEDIIIDRPQSTGLTDTLPLLLTDIIDFARFRLQNQRSLDLASSVFISRVRRLFTTKQKISTRDVCWALHTMNKEQLFMFLIEQPLQRKEEGLSWKIIKKFCVVLWYDDVNQIKKWVEKIALSEYRITKDPFDCLLWYILLGKKNILLALMKKNQQNIKTAEFLQRDFTQPNHKTAASKNAYALLSKKRSEHAIAFFILAGAFNDAITVCLNQLQDPHLAILICKIFKEEIGSQMIKQIYEKTILETGKTAGDPWMMHIAYCLLGQHIQSYNCLFEEDCNFEVPTPTSGAPIVCATWKAEFDPELSLFHPSIVFFSNVVKDSLQFKRELQEKGEQFVPSVNYQNIINHSIDYYIRLNIPQLAIAFTIQNLQLLSLNSYRKHKLVDGYLNSLMSLVIKSRSVRTALPMIKQISELLKVDQSKMLEIFQKRIENIDCGELLFDFYIQTGNLIKTKQYIYNFKNELVLFMLHKNISRLQTSQPYLVAFHLIYWGEKIIAKCQQLNLQVKDFQIYICMLKLIILLKLEVSKNILEFTQQVLDLLSNKSLQQILWDDATFQNLMKLIPSRGNRIETVKTSKKMDILEETFRKTQEEETIASVIPSQTDLVFLVFRKLFFSLLLCRIPTGNFLQEIVIAERNRADEQLSIFLLPDRIQTIMNEYLEVVSSGVYSWNKTAVLSSNSQIDKDQIVPVLQLLGAQSFLTEKAGAYRFEQLKKPSMKQNASLKQSIFKNGIEIFKNRAQPIKSFILNNFEGSQNQGIVLFRRNMRKIDLYQCLLNRPRTSEGCYLAEDDSTFNTNESPKSVHSTPLINTCVDMLKCSFSKKVSGAIRYQKVVDLHLNSYLKQLDPLPFVNYNELNSIASHRYLPLFFVGARSNIDVYSFSNLKNFNKIQCQALTDIVKINTNHVNDLIGGLDSDGTFLSMHFDSSYNGATSILVRKTGVIDFCYLNSNIVATGCKDGSINVYDPLLHPSRNTIFRERLTGLSCMDYSPKSNVLIANRRTQLCTYDLRRGMLNRMQVGNDISCLTVDPATEYIYAGTANGEVKIFEVDGTQLMVLRPFRSVKKSPSISEMRVSRGNLFVLSSDGVITYAFS